MLKLQTEVAPSPSDTTVPGLTQRRVWKAPQLLSHSLVVLTLPRLYLTPMTGAPKTEIIGQLQTVRLVETFLGPLATAIDLHAVRRVKYDLKSHWIAIDYFTPNDPKARTVIRFAPGEAADQFFAKLWRRLGENYQLQPVAPEWWAFARVPLVFIAAVLLFTTLSAMGLNALSDWGADRHGVGRILPGWKSVCIIGGGLVAAAQIWLYRLATRPPEQLELLPK